MTKLSIPDDVTRSQQELLKLWNRKLRSSEWVVGDYIGSDLALSKEFGYSRTVVRGVLDFLQRSECISRIPRQGVRLEKNFAIDLPVGKAKLQKILFVRWADTPLMLDILEGMQAEAPRHGFKVIQRSLNQDGQALLELLSNPPEECQGMVLTPLETPELITPLKKLVDKGIRVVQLDRYISDINSPSVVFDNYHGGILATRHLFSSHSMPVYYYGCLNPVSVRKRYEGWRDVMIENGFSRTEEYLVPIPDENGFELLRPEEFAAKGHDLLKGFLQNIEKPVSIFAQHDIFARQLYDAASELGLQIGRDIFLVGFDNLDLCDRMDPGLTSISVPRRELGVEAMKILADWSREISGSCRILSVDLMVRKSS